MNQDKWIYSFTLNKEVSVQKSEKSKNDAGEEITITKNVKEKKPFSFKIKKPNRRTVEEGDIFYAAKVGEYLKAGLLSRTLIAKRFENDGGDLGEITKEEYSKALNDYYSCQLDLNKITAKPEAELTDEDKTKMEELKERISELRSDLTDFDMQRNAIYDQSAESKALNRQIFWYILNLTYWNEGKEDGEFKSYFNGKTFEEKSDSYDVIENEDGDSEFFASLTGKLAFAISYWFNSGNKATEKDILDAENRVLSNE